MKTTYGTWIKPNDSIALASISLKAGLAIVAIKESLLEETKSNAVTVVKIIFWEH